jgi:hypothetical protein
VVGIAVGLRLLPRIGGITTPVDANVGFLPPAWFATVLVPASDPLPWSWRAAPIASAAAALLLLAVCPLPKPPRARATGGWLAFLLAPARALATRAWVRRDERPAFDLVYDALPLERDFVLRTYPMIGIPLAFLVAGSRGADDAMRRGLLAVLLFTPAAYLPILLVHVPATASAEARWILETSPLPAEAHASGAVKAVAVRFLLPLYTLLFLLAWTQADLAFAVRIALPAGILASILLRALYAKFVKDLPLSVAPDEVEARLDWTGLLTGLGIGLTLAAILAVRFVTSLGVGIAIAAILLVVGLALERRPAAGADLRPH